MSQELKRIAPALRHMGIDVMWSRENDRMRTKKIAVRAVRPVQDLEGQAADEQPHGLIARVPTELIDGNLGDEAA